MLKKLFFVALIAAFMLSGCKKEPPQPPSQPPSSQSDYQPRPRPEPVEQAKPMLPPADQLGQKTTFELTYHGITGKDDDLYASGGWGFGGTDEVTPFIRDVQKVVKDNLFIARNFYLYGRELSGIEYKDKEILYAYFDINADGKLSDDERLSPVEITQQIRRGNDTTVFISPDFDVTDNMGNKAPFRILLWVAFYNNRENPNVTWSPMGLYEGVAELNGQPMRLYLFPSFNSKSYTHYGRSQYALVPVAQDKSEYVRRSTFSSLVVHDKQFYRIAVDTINPEAKTITVSLMEDKSPRGKIAMDVKGKEEFTHQLSSATVKGKTDPTVYFFIREDTNELPVGDYFISYGSLKYGVDETGEYLTSFRDIPTFAVNADQTTNIEMGSPKVNVQAVEKKQRYNQDKIYKTEFPEGTEIYVDATFAGTAGEVYRSFVQYAEKENGRRTRDTIDAHILIKDADGNEIANETLEYG